MQTRPISVFKGRGATVALEGRFESRTVERFDDGWLQDEYDTASDPKTRVTEETARSIISRNQSPDIAFEQSLNPYRGCEHGCPYCYARPSHAYLNLSPAMDFETKLFAKTNAAALLRTELAKKGYVPSPINFGANTDPYQPIERQYEITRKCLQVLHDTKHPCTIVTKNALITRDINLLAAMAKHQLVHVFISITSLDNALSRILEPRASAPMNRIRAIERLTQAGVPASVLVAPIMPFITDEWMERVMEQAKQAGALTAGYTVIRLPWEVNPIFQSWLQAHFPDRAQRVMERIRDMRDGRDNSAAFGQRMKGTGIYAELIKRRFEVARARLRYLRRNQIELVSQHFVPPAAQTTPAQALLFD